MLNAHVHVTLGFFNYETTIHAPPGTTRTEIEYLAIEKTIKEIGFQHHPSKATALITWIHHN